VSAQLPLNVRLRDGSSFDNYWAGRNGEAVASLKGTLDALAGGSGEHAAVIYLWGEPGTGRTHLLEAACHMAQARGLSAAFVPLAEARALAPAVLEDRELTALVCLDDLDAVAGDATWERALFALAERLRASRGTLLVGARSAPAQLGLTLPDLASRLAWGLVYQLHALSDADKLDAVRRRAARRGLELSDEVARYILHRYARDLHSLFGLLERLDQASLAQQRRITIPFLRELEP
jgi:DnaA family protein